MQSGIITDFIELRDSGASEQHRAYIELFMYSLSILICYL